MATYTTVALLLAVVAVTGVTLHSYRRNRRRSALLLALHPLVLLGGVGGFLLAGPTAGEPWLGVYVWGVLWPLVIETASAGRPDRVAQILDYYLQFKFALPFTREHAKYRRLMRPLRPTEIKGFFLLPVAAAVWIVAVVVGPELFS